MDFVKDYSLRPEDDFYSLLGCDELSSPEQIVAEYRSRVLGCHPDKHPGNDEKKKHFQVLLRAKETLCSPESREKYDRWRRSQLAIPYDEFEKMGEHVHMTMHWATPKKEAMLKAKSTSPPPATSSRGLNYERDSQGSRSFDDKILESSEEEQECKESKDLTRGARTPNKLAEEAIETDGKRKPVTRWVGSPCPRDVSGRVCEVPRRRNKMKIHPLKFYPRPRSFGN